LCVYLQSGEFSNRAAAGFLNALGVSELVATDVENYAQTAVRVASSSQLRTQLARRIVDGLDALRYNNVSALAWQELLLAAGRGQPLTRWLPKPPPASTPTSILTSTPIPVLKSAAEASRNAEPIIKKKKKKKKPVVGFHDAWEFL
jgi:hypothetical protein